MQTQALTLTLTLTLSSRPSGVCGFRSEL